MGKGQDANYSRSTFLFPVVILPVINLPISTELMSRKTTLGELGEQLVAQWLLSQGWKILHQRWSCRWGEIDLIAHHSTLGEPQLIFVEVKTRSHRNWDFDGLLAITPQKQQKLILTAQLFLTEYPHLVNVPCRFDVALVSSTRSDQAGDSSLPKSFNLGQPINFGGYQLTVQEYIPSAFELA